MDRAKVKTLERIVSYFLKLNVSVAIADNVIDVPKEKEINCTPFKFKIAYVKDIEIPLFCDESNFDLVMKLFDDMISLFGEILGILDEAEEIDLENLIVKKEVLSIRDFLNQFQKGTFEYELIAILLSLTGGLMILTCFCLCCYCATLRMILRNRDRRTIRQLGNL